MLLPDGERKTNKQISNSKKKPPLKAWKELPTVINLSILTARAEFATSPRQIRNAHGNYKASNVVLS